MKKRIEKYLKQDKVRIGLLSVLSTLLFLYSSIATIHIGVYKLQNNAKILAGLVAEKQSLATELQNAKKTIADYAMIEAGKEQYRQLINASIADIEAKVKSLPTTQVRVQQFTTIPNPAKGIVEIEAGDNEELDETSTSTSILFMTPSEQLSELKNEAKDLIEQKKKSWATIAYMFGLDQD